MPGPSTSRGPRSLGNELRRVCEELQTLRSATEELTERRGRLIVALIDTGRSYAEIAEHCGLSRGRIAQIAATSRS